MFNTFSTKFQEEGNMYDPLYDLAMTANNNVEDINFSTVFEQQLPCLSTDNTQIYNDTSSSPSAECSLTDTTHKSIQNRSIEFNENEALFGQGNVANYHTGNVIYQNIVKHHLRDNRQTNTTEQKRKIFRNIIDTVHTSKPSGRFLNRTSDSQYYEAGEEPALIDISRALPLIDISRALLQEDLSIMESSSKLQGEDTNYCFDDSKCTSDTTIGSTRFNSTENLRNSITTRASDGATVDHTIPVLLTKPTRISQSNYTNVNVKDVLCGRGDGPNRHIGNIIYRDLIEQYKRAYLSTNKRRTKREVAELIVNTVHASGGKFLKKDATGEWCKVNMAIALEKVSQALRQGSSKLGKDPKKV